MVLHLWIRNTGYYRLQSTVHCTVHDLYNVYILDNGPASLDPEHWILQRTVLSVHGED